MNQRGTRGSAYTLGFTIILLLLLFFALFPLLWIALTSIKSQRDLFAIPPLFIFKPTFEHWQKILLRSEFLRYYKNSLIIAVSTVVSVMVIATLAAYGLVRGHYKTKVRDNIAFFILSQRMMPAVAVVLPIYILFSGIRMLDRLQTLIFMNIAFNLPLSIWMIRGFVEGLSSEIEEAAIVDGCTPFGAFFKVGLPQIVPGLLSTALLVFIYTINEFLFCAHSFRNPRPTGLHCGSTLSSHRCARNAFWRSRSSINSDNAPEPSLCDFHAAVPRRGNFAGCAQGVTASPSTGFRRHPQLWLRRNPGIVVGSFRLTPT